LRELIFNSVSPSMKNGIAAGIGLFIAFIAFIGLRQAVGLSAQNRFAADARWHHRGG
jgi:xanthine/uracil/vitamin C permease (AzgA family)